MLISIFSSTISNLESPYGYISIASMPRNRPPERYENRGVIVHHYFSERLETFLPSSILSHITHITNDTMIPTNRSVRSSYVKVHRLLLSRSTRHNATSPFGAGPAPPRLPKEEQELYEQLQKSSTGAFSTPSVKPTVVVDQSSEQISKIPSRRPPQINQSPASAADKTSTDQNVADVTAKVTARGKGEELHPDVRRGAKPEFEGERNPKTGEIGGPKNDPLRWGGGVDWSYNGRVTDF